MIQGHGPSKPKGFLIADAPQGEDFKSNYALSGYQSNLLKQLLKAANLNYDDFYRTCFIKDAALASNGYPNAKELEASQKVFPVCGPLLINEIKALNPFLLIPMGELSFNFLTGLKGIRKFRGSVLTAEGSHGFEKPLKVMPILGPYPYLYSDPKQRTITQIDVNKISKYLNFDPPPEHLMKIWVCRSSSALRQFFNRSYTPDGLLVFDIETFGGVITCISFCFDGFESICVPFVDQSIRFEERVLMLDLVAKLLASPIKKVNQNIKYDWKILERWNFKVENIVGDTMIAAGCLYCEFPKNLGFLTSIYTDLPYFKDEGKYHDPSRFKKESYFLYNAKDSLAVRQIHPKQQAEVDELGVRFVHDNLIRLMPIYKQMEDNGIRVDNEQRLTLLSSYLTLYEVHLRQIRLMTGNKDFNPRSPDQCHTLIFNEMGYSLTQRGVHGTDEESLLLLLAKGEAKHAPIYGDEILREIINCRKIQKVIEILELPLYPDGRFRCEFNLVGTDTGRTSAGKTTDEIYEFNLKGKVVANELGHSLQTIGKHGFVMDGKIYGKDIRSIYIPSRGYVFVECDLSQAEARVDAVLSGNYDILKVFDGPVGIHRLTGSWVFDCKPEDIKKDTLEYHLAKTVRHAAERNIAEDGLMSMTQQPIQECKRILAKVHEKQPELRQVFHRDVITAVNTTRVLIAPNGRRHDYFGRIDQNTYNKAISQLPQAIVSDQTKFSLPYTLAAFPAARLLAEAHDGTLAETPVSQADHYALVYKKNIETAIDFRTGSLIRPYSLTIPCEATIGYTWQEMRKLKI